MAPSLDLPNNPVPLLLFTFASTILQKQVFAGNANAHFCFLCMQHDKNFKSMSTTFSWHHVHPVYTLRNTENCFRKFPCTDSVEKCPTWINHLCRFSGHIYQGITYGIQQSGLPCFGFMIMERHISSGDNVVISLCLLSLCNFFNGSLRPCKTSTTYFTATLSKITHSNTVTVKSHDSRLQALRKSQMYTRQYISKSYDKHCVTERKNTAWARGRDFPFLRQQIAKGKKGSVRFHAHDAEWNTLNSLLKWHFIQRNFCAFCFYS